MSRALAFGWLLLGGCTVDLGAHPAFVGCADDSGCAIEQRCDRGFCVPSMNVSDASPADAGVPGDDAATRDAATAPDGGCGDEVVCNGVDDDCDDAVDEFPFPACETGIPGLCGNGEWVCSGGAPICASSTRPVPEACNGLDDDCDDDVDELGALDCYPAGTSGCSDEDGDGDFECLGACATGTSICSDGTLGACAGAVVPAIEETCGGTPTRDDDCDGLIDEGCDCTGDVACYGGPDGTRGVGACIGGSQACSDGALDPSCVGQVVPAMETCSNPMVDDDCNGVTDDVPRRGEPCIATGAIGECQLGRLGCGTSGPELECLPSAPGIEVCDGNDDDCDSRIDEGFDLATDEANCGACGVACGADETCCGGACVDTRMEAGHCGACAADGGDTCGASEVCCNGDCADALSCGTCSEDCGAVGRDCCRGACVDYQTDENNCGACGNACGPGAVCCSGACVGSDASHCGQGCDVCAAGSELCCSGSCVTIGNMYCNACGVSCASGECCDSGCADLDGDAMNCGACGNACPGGQVCSAGNCCPSGQSWCAAAGACRDLANDADNCGSCGRSCGFGSVCCGGGCRALALGC